MTTTPKLVDFKNTPRTPPGQLWILIEWDKGDKPNGYAVIDANDVIGHTNSEKMHTGKAIYVRRGHKTLQATIVIISDDKSFLDTELLQLRNMNLSPQDNKQKVICMNGNVSDYQNIKLDENIEIGQSRKKRRISTDSVQKDSSTWKESSLPFTTNSYIPPMTFDQQTQTDSKFCGQDSNTVANNSMHITNLIQKNDLLLNEIRSVRYENRQQKDMIKYMNTELSVIKQFFSDISIKLDNINMKTEVNGLDSNINKYEYKIIETAEEEYNFETIKPKESSEAMKLCSNNSTTLNVSSVLSNSNMSLNESVTNNSEIIEMIKADCPDHDLGPDGHIPIGSNRTLIPVHILESVNWKSPSAATRKLLTAVFSRETLATHTLTGKPSPAFHDREKPLKNQLDALKVADITHLVSKFCRVPETIVRCAITTKCADENKMFRQREDRKRKSLIDDNKENSVLRIIN